MNKKTFVINSQYFGHGDNKLGEQSVLDTLEGLAKEGVDLIACGTCVTHFDLKQKIVVGRISDMNEIATNLISSSSVVTI